MIIPNADRAIVEIVKLRKYCLNKEHPRGKHKARLFEAKLGFTENYAQELQNTLLAIVKSHNAIEVDQDQFGKRYIIDFVITKKNRRAKIRS